MTTSRRPYPSFQRAWRRARLGVLLVSLAAGGNARAGSATADTPLLEVWVPGAVHNVYDPPNKQLNPLLNPKTPPPSFVEDNAVSRHCGTGLAFGAALVDRAAYESAQQAGRDTAQARHVWQFNQQRQQAQSKVVDGVLARSSREPVGPRPTGNGEPAPRGRVDAAPAPRPGGAPRITASGLLGMLGIKPQQQAAPSPAPGLANIRAHMTDYDKLHEQLQVNEAVLAAQDEQLKAREQQYARALTQVYAQALDRLAATTQPVPLAVLNDFEQFRAHHVEPCIGARSLPDAATRAQLDAVFDRYRPLADASIAAARPQVLRDIHAATNPAAFREAWTRLFSTPWLSATAEKDTELAQPVAARMGLLIAQEKREREEAESRAAAEAARQVALVKQRYLDNAARNVAPAEDEVAKLATTYLMANTDAEGQLGHLRRVTDRSFDQEINHFLWGRRRITHTVVLVNDLRCQPKGKVQSCTAKVNTTHYRLQEGLPDRQEFSETRTVEADYQWTAEGLESAGLRKGASAIVSVTVSSSGGGGNYGSDRAAQRERDAFNRELARRGAAMSGEGYDGQSNRELRREFGYGR